MKKEVIFIILIFSISLISLISAQDVVMVGFDDSSISQVNIQPPEVIIPGNQSWNQSFADNLFMLLDQGNWVFGDTWNLFDGTTWTYNDSRMNDTIDLRTASKEFNASIITTITGTLDAGSLSDVLIRDNIFYNVSEVTGTPGYNIQLNYTKVSNFNDIVARLNYDGSPAHEFIIELFDCTTGLYDKVDGEFTDTDGIADIIIEVLDAPDHICGVDQNVSLQIRHTSSGNPAHDLFIDGVHLVKGATTASPTEIDPLSIHKSGDVVWEGNEQGGGFNSTGWDYCNANVGNFSELKVLDYSNVTIAESQISDLIHTVNDTNLNVLQINATIINATTYNINPITGACDLTKSHSLCANSTGTYLIG